MTHSSHRASHRPTFAANYLRVFENLVALKGYHREDLLAESGVPAAALDDPTARITPRQNMTIVKTAIRLTDEPALGVYFGLQMKLSSHGFLGFAVMSSATLGEALKLGVKYLSTRTPLLDMHYDVQPEKLVIHLVETVELGDLRVFTIESMLSSLFVIGRDLVGDKIFQAKARVSYPQPDYYERVYHLIPSDIRFGCAVNEIELPSSFFDLRLKLADEAALKLAEEQCQKELALVGRFSNLRLRVWHHLDAHQGRYPSLDAVADWCAMSPRTLKRNLSRLGCSYQALLDDVRKAHATRLLEKTHQPVENIAAQLGYSDAANFSRAFKKWTGATPGQYRRHL